MAQNLSTPGGIVSYYDGSFTIDQLRLANSFPITLMPFRTGLYPVFFGLTLKIYLTGMGVPLVLRVGSNYQLGLASQIISQLDVPSPAFQESSYNIFPNAYGLFFDFPVYGIPTDTRNFLELSIPVDDPSLSGPQDITYRLYYSFYS
jgi:hypothetical protein